MPKYSSWRIAEFVAITTSFATSVESMAMPMMCVGIVRVAVFERIVVVWMRVRLTFGVVRIVVVWMVLIVNVKVFVCHWLVDMLMSVGLGHL